jgi:hypothetical protein
LVVRSRGGDGGVLPSFSTSAALGYALAEVSAMMASGSTSTDRGNGWSSTTWQGPETTVIKRKDRWSSIAYLP